MKRVKAFRLVKRKNLYWFPINLLFKLLTPKYITIHVTSRKGKTTKVKCIPGNVYCTSSHFVTFGNETDSLFYQLVRYRAGKELKDERINGKDFANETGK